MDVGNLRGGAGISLHYFNLKDLPVPNKQVGAAVLPCHLVVAMHKS